ncbi:MAG: PQQ-binding-like beta-propeller repeat protein, partial [Lentisphaerae bacterium]|nr:PQQ-binding-like beta-propeller repeat protein [Lentisphaerota bacterium]
MNVTLPERLPRSMSRCLLVSALLLVGTVGLVRAADWPMFRHDPGRTAATDGALAPVLHLRWARRFPELVPAWLGEFPHLRFDEQYEPIVAGKLLYLASSDDDSVSAYDTETGKRLWRFYANGPVRLAPVVADGRVTFGADDGVCYCLDAATGVLLWTYDAYPEARRGFIEGRLASVLPIRGAPLAVDGLVHFAAGIWSFEDASFFTLNPVDGSVVRTYKDRRSQGYISAVGPWLCLPNGRASVVRLSRQTGAWAGGMGGWAGYWDHLVAGNDEWIVRMGALQRLAKEPKGTVCDPGAGRTETCFYRPILTEETIYFSAAKPVVPRIDKIGPEISDVVACSLVDPAKVECVDKDGNAMKDSRGKPRTKLVLSELWRLPKEEIVAALKETTEPAGKRACVILELKAGNRLYGYRGSTVFGIDIPNATAPARVTWTATVKGTPARMVAADGKLFVVTRQGRLYCFGGTAVSEPTRYPLEEHELAQTDDDLGQKAQQILDAGGATDGYCLVLGLRDGRLVEELFKRTQMHIIAMDVDADRVRALRETLSYLKDPAKTGEERRELKDGTPLIATASAEIGPRRRRVAVLQADPARYEFPPYMADLIVSETPDRLPVSRLVQCFDALRPYGGRLCLEMPKDAHTALGAAADSAALANAALVRKGGLTVLTRTGALPGAADWTHEWADPANTLKSNDHLAAPLAMLWTGGRSARRAMYFDRHYVPPAPVVIDGRMFLAGPQRLAAIDVYTGRVIWDVRSKLFQAMTRGRGGCHTVGTNDGVYVNTRPSILRFAPESGELLSEFSLPEGVPAGAMWGRARLWQDTLISGVKVGRKAVELLSVDRHTGKVRWRRPALSSFSQVAVGNGKVFCFDGSAQDLAALKPDRRGELPPPIRGRTLQAWDARNGRELWQIPTDAVVDWLSYSESLDVLVASTKKRIHAYSGRTGRELWHKYSEGIGFRGHPGRVWQKVILWHDWMIDQRGPGLAYDLLTGKQVTRLHPVTLKPVPWEFIRNGHHCNHGVGSENFLTFRSGDATFVDLTTLGTGSFPGYRSGCTNSVLPAAGVMSSPMFAHLCVCGYEFYTALAFAHKPDHDLWTYRPNKADFVKEASVGRVRRLGLNVNAPGDRRSANGTLWFGLSRARRRSYSIAGLPMNWGGTTAFEIGGVTAPEGMPPWVFRTGVEGIKTLNVPLSPDKDIPESLYTVRVYLAEPSADKKAGERVFSISIDGTEVLSGVDIVKEAGGGLRGLVKEIEGVKGGATMSLAFAATHGTPVVCGVEVLDPDAPTIPPEVHSAVVEAKPGVSKDIDLRCTDLDGPGPLTFRVTASPTKGTLSGIGATVSYTASTGAFGEDQFRWLANDGKVDSTEATVTICISAPNRAPVAMDAEAAATAGKAVDIRVTFSDPDKQPGIDLAEIVAPPGHGTVVVRHPYHVVYTSAPGFEGVDEFTWKVNDGLADSNTATVRVRVTPDKAPPGMVRVD